MSKFHCLGILGLLLAATAASAQVYTAGTTWAPYQHQGSCGRMIGVDGMGFVHVMWMNDLNAAHNPRHVYYNVRDETGWFFQPGGALVNPSMYAGWPTTIVTSEGWCFPAYASRNFGETHYHSCAAVDFLGGAGAYTPSCPEYITENGQPLAISHPKLCRTANNNLQMVSADVSAQGNVQRIYYSRGTPVFDPDGFGMDITWATFEGGVEFALLDTAIGLAHTIAASRTGSRVAVAYTRPVAGFEMADLIPSRDVYVIISENGGQTWGAPLNITVFRAPSVECLFQTANYLCCRGDTLSAGADISLLFDNDNILHAAFPTYRYMHWDSCGGGPFIDRFKAIIWHWSETVETITEIAEEWTADSLIVEGQSPMPGHYMVERPSLAIHPANDDFFCVYLRYNREAYSEAGYFNADVFGTRSGDNGVDWSVSVNLTNSNPHPDDVPAPAGESQNEQDVTVAETVQGGQLHLTYLFEKAADPNPEVATQNGFCYHRVETTEIPTAPLLESRPLHVEAAECDTLPLADAGASQLILEEDTLVAGSEDSTHLTIILVHLNGDTMGPETVLTISHTGESLVSEPVYVANGTFAVTITAPADTGVDAFDIAQVGIGCSSVLGSIAMYYVPPDAADQPVAEIPTEVLLDVPRPNPFNSSTTISYSLPRATSVFLRVVDILGREADILQSGVMTAGRHTFSWNAADQASGIYFVLLETPARRDVQKVMLLK